jgi:primosomal protein N' (replication factor Y)
MDRDTVQNIGSAEKILTSFRAGEFNILLGTQMVAKGHDFPNVQLVGVVAADTGSSLPDFRTSERMFQLLTQVAGRAGRHQEGGRVLLQSWNPQDQVFRFALKHDYERFAEWELAQRKELLYPPYARLLALEVEGTTLAEVDATCTQISQQLSSNPDLTFHGPVDAFVARIRKQHRKQFLVKAATAVQLRKACMEILAIKCKSHIKADIDPTALL